MNRFGVLLASLLLLPALAPAAVLNVEFKFTAFKGNPDKEKTVESVPGKARIFLNNVPFAEQEVRKESIPVLFEEREVAASVWLPMESAGPAVRKGKNKIRIEFEPADTKTAYRARLAWATVTDQVTRQNTGPGSGSATNMSEAGKEDKAAAGKVVLEREFTADFATDRPWHHYPAVTALSDADRSALAEMLKTRAEWFKPGFAEVYKSLEGRVTEPGRLAKVRKAKCLDAAYGAGVRIAAPAPGELEFVTTGNPEVVLRRKGGDLFALDRKAFERIKGDETQMCAGMTLFMLYAPQLVVVRAPGGTWEVAY
ncbi:MAG: hypothetical protein ABI699_15580 [Caldimonas sp.]